MANFQCEVELPNANYPESDEYIELSVESTSDTDVTSSFVCSDLCKQRQKTSAFLVHEDAIRDWYTWIPVSKNHTFLCNVIRSNEDVKVGDVIMIGPVGSIDANSPRCKLYTVRNLCPVQSWHGDGEMRYYEIYLREVKRHHYYRYIDITRNLNIIDGYYSPNESSEFCIYGPGQHLTDLTDFLVKAVSDKNASAIILVTSREIKDDSPYYNEHYGITESSELFDRIVLNDFSVDCHLRIGVV